MIDQHGKGTLQAKHRSAISDLFHNKPSFRDREVLIQDEQENLLLTKWPFS
jgi:hypothetical protein